MHVNIFIAIFYSSIMAESKTYECQECGEVFDRPIDLAKHTKSEHPKAKGEGVTKTSYLTSEDLEDLREQEKMNRQLELEAKRAELELRKLKAQAEMKRYETSSEPPKERTRILPDGTSFQGSSADYREMLQLYLQTQNVAKKATAETENPTVIKAMLDRIAELEKTVSETKMKDIENKINYIASRDPLSDAQDALKKFHSMAQEQGLVPAGSSVADTIKIKHAEIQTDALKTSIDTLSRKIDNSMRRANQLEHEFLPVARKLTDLYIDDFKFRRRAQLGEPVPITEQELVFLQKNLEKNEIQQETAPAEKPKPEQKPEKPVTKQEPPKMKTFDGANKWPGFQPENSKAE